MNNDTIAILAVGVAGLLAGIWWMRQQQQPTTSSGVLFGSSTWGQVPIASFPGPQASWSLI